MAKAPAKKKKKEVVLTPAEKFQQYKTLMRATRCIIKVTDEYKIFVRLAKDFEQLYQEGQADPFEGLEECPELSRQCREKAEALKAKLPSEEEGSSQTVTTTAKEREERAKEAGRKKKISKTKVTVIAAFVLVIALAVSYKVTPTRYLIAGAERVVGLNKYAMESYGKLGDYKDSQEKMKEARYAYADSLGDDQMEQARYLFELLAKKGYKDSDARELAIEKALIEKAEPGKTVHFGKDSWILLEKKDGEARLARKTGLEAAVFHDTDEAVTWETCDLRAYLNGTYLQEEFTEAERQDMAQMSLENPDNEKYKTKGGIATKDYVCIFDTIEYEKYRDILKGKANCLRLRTPGNKPNTTVCTSYQKELILYGIPVDDPGVCVRPVILVKY